MKTLFKNSILAVIFTLLLSACGEESEVSSQKVAASTSTSTNTDSTSTSTSIHTDSFIMNTGAVNGLKVMCGSVELAMNTDEFVQCENSLITVYLGDFKLGDVESLPADGIIYIQDLLHLHRGAIAHPEVTKISMILQSLDGDANPSNGISLDSNVIALLGSHINSSTALEDLTFEEVDTIIVTVIQDALNQDESLQLEAVNYYTAQSNLAVALANAPALTYEQHEAGGI